MLIKIQHEENFSKYIQKDFEEIFGHLDEGIAIVENNQISFTNNTLIKVISTLKKLPEESHQLNQYILNLKIFKLIRIDDGESQDYLSSKKSISDKRSNKSHKSTSTKTQENENRIYSIKELLTYQEQFF